MTKKQKKMLVRIIISFVILAAEMILFGTGAVSLGRWELAFYLIPYLIIGYDILRKAVLGLINRQLFDESFLMTIATIGAFATGEYSEGTAVMLFYQVGELFQSCAVSRSRRSIAELMDIRPDHANIEDENGMLIEVDPEEIAVGDTIVIKSGEKIPLDGVVISGTSSVDTSALTGESVPRDISEGSEVISGCINLTGTIRVRVSKEFGQSTVAKILELVENSQEKKSRSENFITKFARVYTPAVVAAAVILAVVPPLVTGEPFAEWVYRAMTFLVISCPCALVISVPLSFFSGIGGASRSGILIKGGNYIEALANAGIIAFDKTGTLTKGVFEVTAIHPDNTDSGTLLDIACHAECYSTHPIAASLKKAYGKKCVPSRISDVSEIAGHGVTALIDGKRVCAGNLKLMAAQGITAAHDCHHSGTAVHVSCDDVYMGHIIISDTLKDNAAKAIHQLKTNGIKTTVMLTGDDERIAKQCAEQLKIDRYHAGLLPKDKVDILEELLTEKCDPQTLIFAGDGINDAPVLTRADIGIAMGAMGSDAAIEAADVVLMDDDPAKIATAIRIAQKTMSIVRQNIVFALGIKAAVLILGALGFANMWAAVFADVGVSVIAIINATRSGQAEPAPRRD